jgi:hypothetical protein
VRPLAWCQECDQAYAGEVGSIFRDQRKKASARIRPANTHHEVPLAWAVRLNQPTMMSLASITHTPPQHHTLGGGYHTKSTLASGCIARRTSPAPHQQPSPPVRSPKATPYQGMATLDTLETSTSKKPTLAPVPQHTGPCLSMQAHRQEIIRCSSLGR